MRLTEKRKREIRRLYNLGMPVYEIATMYKVSEAQIVAVVTSR